MALTLPSDPNAPEMVLRNGKITTRGWNILTANRYSFYSDAITKNIRMITPMELRTLEASMDFFFAAPAAGNNQPLTRRNLVTGTSNSIGTVNIHNNTFIIYDNRLYLLRIENGLQSIYSYALDLTDEQLVATFGNTRHNRMTRDDSHFYSLPNNSTELQRYDLTGHTEGGLVTTDLFDTELELPQGITTTGSHIFISDTNTDHVYRFDLDGSNRTDLFDTRLAQPRGMTTDGTYLYILDFSTDHVLRHNLDGSGGTDLFNTNLSNPRGVATDGTYFYITERGDDHVYRYNLDGTGRTDHFDTEIGRAAGIASDGTHLYILSQDDNHVYRYNLDGSGRTDYLDPGLAQPRGIESDGTYLYITDTSTDHVFRYQITAEQGRTQVADLGISDNNFTVLSDNYVFVYGREAGDTNQKIFRFNKSDGLGKITVKTLNGINWVFTDGTYLYYVYLNQIHRINFDGTEESVYGSAHNQRYYAGPVPGNRTRVATLDNLFESDAALYWDQDLPPGTSHDTDSIVKMRIELEAHIPFNLDFAWESELVAEPHAVNGGIDFEIYGSNDQTEWTREVFDEGGPFKNSSLETQQNINLARFRYIEFRWTEKQGLYFRKLQFTRFRAFPVKFEIQPEKITFQDP